MKQINNDDEKTYANSMWVIKTSLIHKEWYKFINSTVS